VIKITILAAMKGFYFFNKAITNISRNLSLNLFTVIIIASSLAILNLFLLISYNLDNLLEKHSSNSMFVYLKDSKKEDIDKYKKEISKIIKIKEIIYNTNQEAFNQFKTQLKSDSFLLEGVDAQVIPSYFKVILVKRTEDIEIIAKKIKNLKFVDSVDYGKKIYQKIEKLNNILHSISFYILLFIAIATLFTIYTTVKLTIYNRRSEVETMVLVGATQKFIIMPFYIEGIIQGIFSALLALFFVFGIFKMIISNSNNQIFSSIGLTDIQFIPISYILLNIIITALMGFIASHLSVVKFLKQ